MTPTPAEAAAYLRQLRPHPSPVLDEVYRLAIDALEPWTPPRATIPWVSVAGHPHPVGERILYLADSGSVCVARFVGRDPYVTHWCLVPEGTP